LFAKQDPAGPLKFSLSKPPITNFLLSAFGTNEGAVGLRALGVKELNYKMNFLANNVTVLGLADGLDGEPAELSKTEQEEIKRMMNRRNLYQVTGVSFDLNSQFATHFLFGSNRYRFCRR
jgi:hypothetical protein